MLINVGTNRGNFKEEIDKPFDKITYEDVMAFCRKRFPDETSIEIRGWAKTKIYVIHRRNGAGDRQLLDFNREWTTDKDKALVCTARAEAAFLARKYRAEYDEIENV